MLTIIWSDYMKYRAKLRDFSLEKIEEILRYSSERYFDNGTHRMVVVGKHDNRLVIIPYDKDDDTNNPNYYPRYYSTTDQIPLKEWEFMK